MINNCLILSLLSAIIVLFYIGMQKKEYFDNSQPKCNFTPSGETKKECKEKCNESSEVCKENSDICEEKCNECNDTDCKWVVESLKPGQPEISIKPLVNALEVSWKRPKTKYRIIKYTVVVQKTSDNENKSFYFPIGKGSVNVNYQIIDLDPEETYIVYAIATNRFGDSPISNKVIVSPLKKGALPEDRPVHKLAYQRGEYRAEDLKEVLEKVIESKSMKEPYRVTVRY